MSNSDSNIPIRVEKDALGNTNGLSEFRIGESVGLPYGGTGATNAADARTNLELASIATTSDYNDLINKPVLKTFRYAITEPSLIWTINHNRNSTSFREKLFDSEGSQFHAYVEIVDANTFKVHLSENITGYVDVFFDNIELLPA